MKGEVPIPILANYFRVPYRGGIPVDYPGRDVLLQSRITNISKNGVFVVTRNPLPKGAQFEITFQIPGTKRPIRAECVVRWSTDNDSTKRAVAGMGLEFTRLERKDRKNLERFVRSFLLDMRKRAALASLDSEEESVESPPSPATSEFSAMDTTAVMPTAPGNEPVEDDPFSVTAREPRSGIFPEDDADLIDRTNPTPEPTPQDGTTKTANSGFEPIHAPRTEDFFPARSGFSNADSNED